MFAKKIVGPYFYYITATATRKQCFYIANIYYLINIVTLITYLLLAILITQLTIPE